MHPEDNGQILSDISDIREYENERGKAESAAEIEELRATVHDRDVTINDQREQIETRDEEIGRLGSVIAELKEALRACQEGEDPEPRVCPAGTDRAGQTIPDGETEAWCTVEEPEREDLGKAIGGTWFLKQTTSATERVKAEMERCFNVCRSAVGGGIRYPLNQVIDSRGDLIVSDAGLLTVTAEAFKSINADRDTDYRLSLRPINGQYCPPAWRSKMPAELLYTEAGKTGIHPCYPDGRPNDIYEGLWRKYLQQLVKWRKDRGYEHLIPFIHGTYYSLDYSEYYNGPPTRQPRAGYSQAAHRNAHLRLATIMHEELPDDCAAEWATTGHGPMVETSNPFIQELTDHLVTLYGSGSDRVYLSYNGWSDLKIAGAPDSTTERAKQAAGRTRTDRKGDLRAEIQDIAAGWTGPWDTAFDWAIGGADDKIGSSGMPPRRTLGKNFEGRGDTYLRNGVFPIEIYTFRTQGTSGNAQYAAQLEANARAHREHVLSLFDNEEN